MSWTSRLRGRPAPSVSRAEHSSRSARNTLWSTNLAPKARTTASSACGRGPAGSVVGCWKRARNLCASRIGTRGSTIVKYVSMSSIATLSSSPTAPAQNPKCAALGASSQIPPPASSQISHAPARACSIPQTSLYRHSWWRTGTGQKRYRSRSAWSAAASRLNDTVCGCMRANTANGLRVRADQKWYRITRTYSSTAIGTSRGASGFTPMLILTMLALALELGPGSRETGTDVDADAEASADPGRDVPPPLPLAVGGDTRPSSSDLRASFSFSRSRSSLLLNRRGRRGLFCSCSM